MSKRVVDKHRDFGGSADLQLKIKTDLALKTLPSEVKDVVIERAMKHIFPDNDDRYSIINTGGIKTLIIKHTEDDFVSKKPLKIKSTDTRTPEIVMSDKAAENTLMLINHYIMTKFNDIVEEITDSEATSFHRNFTFFESTINDGILTINWS